MLAPKISNLNCIRLYFFNPLKAPLAALQRPSAMLWAASLSMLLPRGLGTLAVNSIGRFVWGPIVCQQAVFFPNFREAPPILNPAGLKVVFKKMAGYLWGRWGVGGVVFTLLQ